MSVVIEPSEQLEFHRPFTRVVKESLLVKNPGSEPVIFKVKTTAPKQYCVRPNAGRIEPNSEIEVQIILQPFKEELPEDYKCKDKFLVQTAPINPTFEQQDITNLWSHVEATEKSSMHQHKIRCVFLGPRESEFDSHIASTNPEPVTSADGIASSTVPPSIPVHKKEPVTSNIASAVDAPAPIAAATATAHSPSTRDIPAPAPAIPSQPNTSVPLNTSTPASPIPPVSREIPRESVVPVFPTEKDEVPSTGSHNTPLSAPERTSSEVPPAPLAAAVAAPLAAAAATVAATVPEVSSATSSPLATTPPTITTPPAAANSNNNNNNITHHTSDNDDKERELKEAREKIARLEKQLNDIRKEEGLRARNQTGTSSRKLASTVQPLDAVHQHLAALEKDRPTEGYPPQVVMGAAMLAFIIAYLFF